MPMLTITNGWHLESLGMWVLLVTELSRVYLSLHHLWHVSPGATCLWRHFTSLQQKYFFLHSAPHSLSVHHQDSLIKEELKERMKWRWRPRLMHARHKDSDTHTNACTHALNYMHEQEYGHTHLYSTHSEVGEEGLRGKRRKCESGSAWRIEAKE